MVNVVRIEGVASGATTAIDISPYCEDHIGRLVTARIIRNTNFHEQFVGSVTPDPGGWAGSAVPVNWAGSATPVVWAGSAAPMPAWAGSVATINWAGSANVLHAHSFTISSLGSGTSGVTAPSLVFRGSIADLTADGSFAAVGIAPAGSAAALIPAGSIAPFTVVGSYAAGGAITPQGSFGVISGTRITNQWIHNSGLLDIANTTPAASSVTLSGRMQIHMGSPIYSTDTIQLRVQYFKDGGIF